MVPSIVWQRTQCDSAAVHTAPSTLRLLSGILCCVGLWSLQRVDWFLHSGYLKAVLPFPPSRDNSCTCLLSGCDPVVQLAVLDV